MRQALDDSEIDIAFNFNPAEASSAIAQGLLPPTVRSYVFDRGSIANTHFLAIPFDANAKAGAMVAANFLMSPEAQARKQDPAIWAIRRCSMSRPSIPRRASSSPDLPGRATLPPEKLGRTLPEPDPSWMTRLTDEWRRRYADRAFCRSAGAAGWALPALTLALFLLPVLAGVIGRCCRP